MTMPDGRLAKPDIEMKLLRAFVSVATGRSFTAGARIVGCSQGAISTRVRMLEEQVGERLFHRNRLNVRLTLAGEKLFPSASALLDQHDRLLHNARSRAVAGSVRIGAVDGFGAAILAPLLERIHERYAAIELQIVCDFNDGLRRSVEASSIDLALLLLAEETATATLLGRSRLRWVGAPDYVFGQDSPIDLASYPEGCPVRASALATLESHDIAYRLTATSWSNRLLGHAIRSGRAITVMPETLVPEDMKVLFQPLHLPGLGEIGVQLLERPDLDNEAARVVSREISENFHDR